MNRHNTYTNINGGKGKDYKNYNDNRGNLKYEHYIGADYDNVEKIYDDSGKIYDGNDDGEIYYDNNDGKIYYGNDDGKIYYDNDDGKIYDGNDDGEVDRNDNTMGKVDDVMEEKKYEEVAGPAGLPSPRKTFLAGLRTGAGARSIPEQLRATIYRRPSPGRRTPTIPIPTPLSDCKLYKKIISVSCNLGLEREDYQKEYEVISPFLTHSQGRTITITENRGGEISERVEKANIAYGYSILDSVITDIVMKSGNACIGGDIQFWLVGSENLSTDKEINEIIPEATSFTIVKDIDRHCSSKQFIYFPLTAYWIRRQHEPLAKQRGKNMDCDLCFEENKESKENRKGQRVKMCEDICISGHAMAVVVDQERKIITYHEPNSSEAPWYGEIAVNLDQLFQGTPYFKDYKIEETGACPKSMEKGKVVVKPGFRSGPKAKGLQLGSELPQCAFFATLFVALRISCPHLSNVELIDALFSLGRNNIELLLRQWTCFLVEYARENGIFTAAKRLEGTWGSVLNNYAKLKALNSVHDASIDQKIKEIAQVISFHVVNGLFLLEQLDEELKRQVNEIGGSGGKNARKQRRARKVF